MINENIQIISDGSCDLSDDEVNALKLKVVPFYVSFDGKTYLKEKEDISVRDFYQQMVDHTNVFPKTSLPTIQDYLDAFEPILNDDKDIICICITTKFSGSFNSALSAKDILSPKYPTRKITIINAMVNTCLQGLLVKEACRMRNNGLLYEDIIENIERIKQTARIYFTVGNLDYLRHGGRIGKLMGLVGATFKIKPIIVLREGEIFSQGLCFSRKKSLLKVIDLVKKHFNEMKEDPNDYRFIVGAGYDLDECENLRKKLNQELQRDDTEMGQIGATIGVHTGPYPIGIGFIRKYDC